MTAYFQEHNHITITEVTCTRQNMFLKNNGEMNIYNVVIKQFFKNHKIIKKKLLLTVANLGSMRFYLNNENKCKLNVYNSFLRKLDQTPELRIFFCVIMHFFARSVKAQQRCFDSSSVPLKKNKFFQIESHESFDQLKMMIHEVVGGGGTSVRQKIYQPDREFDLFSITFKGLKVLVSQCQYSV